MQLRIEGGDVLRKTQTSIDDMNIKDGSIIVVDILDKIQTGSKSKRSAKEEPKLPLQYVVKSGDPE